MRKCTLENCDKKYHAKGFCWNHYQKWRYDNLPEKRAKWKPKPQTSKYIRLFGITMSHATKLFRASEETILLWHKEGKLIEAIKLHQELSKIPLTKIPTDSILTNIPTNPITE